MHDAVRASVCPDTHLRRLLARFDSHSPPPHPRTTLGRPISLPLRHLFPPSIPATAHQPSREPPSLDKGRRNRPPRRPTSPPLVPRLPPPTLLDLHVVPWSPHVVHPTFHIEDGRRPRSFDSLHDDPPLPHLPPPRALARCSRSGDGTGGRSGVVEDDEGGMVDSSRSVGESKEAAEGLGYRVDYSCCRTITACRIGSL